MILLLAYALVNYCSVESIVLGYWLFDIYSVGVGERRDEDNGKLVIEDSGNTEGVYYWGQLKSMGIRIFSKVAVFWDSWEMSNKSFLALPFVIW